MKNRLILIVGFLICSFYPNVYGQLLGTQHLKGINEIHVITVMEGKIHPGLFTQGLSHTDISETVVKELRRYGIDAKTANSNYHSPLLRLCIRFSSDLDLITIDASIYDTFASKRVVIWADAPTTDYYQDRSQSAGISTILKMVNQQTQWLIGDWKKEN